MEQGEHPAETPSKADAALSQLSRAVLKIVGLVIALPVALVLLNAYLAAIGE